MPIEATDAIENVQRSLSLVPPALLAILFLAGPTAAWLLYRFVVQPRTRRYFTGGSDLLWICDRCRSANEVRSSRCYRCAMERDEIDGALQVVDGDGIVSLEPIDVDEDPGSPVGVPVMASTPRARPSVAVGPGRAPAAARAPTPASASAPDLSVALVGDAPRAPIAVGPGAPVTRPGKAAPAVPARPPKVAAAAGRADAEPRNPRKRD